MKSLREVGLGLSVVFGCLLLALVAELYYLLWWKKRVIINRGDVEVGVFNNISSNDSFCCKKLPFSFRSEALNPLELCSSDTRVHEPQQAHNFWNNKPFGGEETVESELFRLQNFPGPPRFLFTIKEETKEDLESEDAKSKGGGGENRSRKGSRSRSLSDFFHVLETPYLTPTASPKYYTPPLTPIKSPHGGGYSSFDSSSEAEFNFLVRSSPPPKFQFLKDAEEKLYRNKLVVRDQENVEAAAATSSSSSSSMFVSTSKHEENDYHLFVLSNSSQILPLECKNVGS